MAHLQVDRTSTEKPETARGPEADREPEPRPPARRRFSYFRRHPGAIWLLLLVVLALAIAGYFFWQYESQRESTDDARIDGHIDPVSARVGGHVIAVNFEDNQYVRAGTVLVQIDPRDYQ